MMDTITIKQVGPDVGFFIGDETEPRGFVRGVVLEMADLMDIEGFMRRHVDDLEAVVRPGQGAAGR